MLGWSNVLNVSVPVLIAVIGLLLNERGNKTLGTIQRKGRAVPY